MKRQHLLIVLILGVIFFLTNGCGGGGGGGGRFTLPGEIPRPPIPPTPTPTPTPTNPDALIASGWDDFKVGAYSSAISKFNEVLAMSGITSAQRAEAYNGLGWAQAKSSGLESAFHAFSQAAPYSNEAKIGLAAVYMQRGQPSSIDQAIQLMLQIGLGDPNFDFQTTHPIGVSNAEAHAMLGYCYYWRNNPVNGKPQIDRARQLDPSADSSVGQIYNTLKKLGFIQ